ncbi:MAG: amidohydrolase [Victivallales bacterium]|nr:amidohydrolase [Victivallales bacterium]
MEKAMLLIQNGMVHNAIDKDAKRCDILVKDGKILQVAPGINPPDGPMEVVDAAGCNVYPGLVDAHSHIGLDQFAIRNAGQDYNEYNDPATPQLRAIDGINPFDPHLQIAAAVGVTCVAAGPGSANVIGGTFAAIKLIGRRVDDMVVKAPVAMKCAFGENPKNCYRTKNISSRMTTASILRDYLAKALEYNQKLTAAGEDPEKKPAWDAKMMALLPVVRREIPLKAHAHRADDMCTAIRIAKEFNVKLTLEHCTEGALIADILAEEKLPLAVGPSMSSVSKAELMQKTFATPGILQRAGCQVSIITDHAVTDQRYLPLMAGFAVKQGMDPFAALQAITINPARHLGIEDRVGSIEVGKDADLVLAEGDILESSTMVRAVYINGIKVCRQTTQFDIPMEGF